MKLENLEIYCVTNKPIPNLENTDLNLAKVGKEKFSNTSPVISECIIIYFSLILIDENVLRSCFSLSILDIKIFFSA